MALVDLATPLAEIHGIGPQFLTKVKRLGIETVRDLLWHFPTRYEDYSQIYPIADLIPGQEATVHGLVEEVSGRRTWKRRLYLVEVTISDETGSIRAVWFNQPYVRNVLQPGRTANLAGKVTAAEDGELYLSNPTYELTSEHERHETTHTGRIVPVYPETRGLTSKGIRYLVKPILERLAPLEEVLPREVLAAHGLPEVAVALRAVHFPDSLEEALIAKRRFALEDLFFLQLAQVRERLSLEREAAPAITPDLAAVKRLLAALPFELTLSQRQALWEILQDMAKPHPMNRFLQGDVGSGKTVVAAIAAIEVARAGYQAVFMAPTEILARQHYRTIAKLFPEFGGGVALLTSSESRAWYGDNLEEAMRKPALLKAIASGRVGITIGTHALLEKGVSFQSLALVVVDEQHRFGVSQRARLAKERRADSLQGKGSPLRKVSRSLSGHGTRRASEGGSQGASPALGGETPAFRAASLRQMIPHFLSMSATPIPRTLALTLFGDLDLSLITELPRDRKPIVTKAVVPEHRDRAYAFIRAQIKKGRQAFVICPRIDPPGPPESSKTYYGELQQLEVKSVKQEYDKLSKKVFSDLRVAMLHGRMKPKEKETVMRSFLERRQDILVATSVVEVGIDIPNATIMMIEGADRFGLAQLYQFRGRVGRGEHQSYCLLFTESTARTANPRLKAIVEARNGFELAERDLKLRGPGEFLGEAQAGMPDLAMKAIRNPELVKVARDAAMEVLRKDPTLAEHPSLADHLSQFEARVHWE